jgi:N-acetyltransferase
MLIRRQPRYDHPPVDAFTDLSPVLRGRLVVLEPLRAEHEEPLRRAAADERVWRYMRIVATEQEVFHRWFGEALSAAEAGTEAPFCIVRRGDGDVVGSSRYLALRPEDRVLEIGHSWIAPEAWGSGANTEAKLLLLGHAFERLGCLRVEFKTDASNARSRAALAALPAQFEGVFRKHMLVRGGQRRDSAWYSVIDEDWPAVKAALEARVAAKV